AVRDAKDEDHVTQKKNIFAEILEMSLIPEVEETPEYSAIVQSTEALSLKMSTVGKDGLQRSREISSEITETAADLIDLRVLFRLDAPDLRKLISGGACIRLSDGTETPVKLQGHGAQRTMIYAL